MKDGELSEEIIQKIKRGEIKRRSEWIYRSEGILKYSIIGVVIILAGLLISGYFSLVSRWGIYEGEEWLHCLKHTPWQSVAAVLLFVLAALLLLRQATLLYRYSFWLIFCLVVVLVLIISCLVYVSDMPDRAMHNDYLLENYYLKNGNFVGNHDAEFVIGDLLKEKGGIWEIQERKTERIWEVEPGETERKIQKDCLLKVAGEKIGRVIKAQSIRCLSVF